MLKRTRQIGKGTIFKTRTRVSLASVLEHFPRDALLGERNRTNSSDMLHASQWLSRSIEIHCQIAFMFPLGVLFHTVMRYKSGAFPSLELIHLWSEEHSGTTWKCATKSQSSMAHMCLSLLWWSFFFSCSLVSSFTSCVSSRKDVNCWKRQAL